MWTDYINSTVVPAAQRVISQCDGTAKVQMDVKNFSIALTELKNALANLESHLKLRFYLVGHSLTLADVFLVSVLAQTFSLAVDKKTRDALLPNLTRYVTLAAQTPVLS
jgi:elongation factor 1-gamma